jgi:Fe-S-cluster containining protein
MTDSVKAIASTLIAHASTLSSFDDTIDVDPSVHCSRCTALCCRLTVMLRAEDTAVPPELTTRNATGHTVMAHRPDGFCVALGPDGRSCSIYEQRPLDCRAFVMGGHYCRAVREDFERSCA